MEETTISVSQETCFHVRHKGEWADIMVIAGQSDPAIFGRDTGYVKVNINSSYGGWAYSWPSIGPGHWSFFLNDLDIDYCLNKLMGHRELYEFDHDKTIRTMKSYILERRQQDDIGCREARNAWNYLDEIYWTEDQREFLDQVYHIPVFSDDYWEWPRYSINPTARGFWDRVWRPWITSVVNSQDLRDAA